ncbi:MAG: UDP-3-O-(3-hydroxymyristoyl)glucosamine N-acyltransferase [Flavobacteriales bacterium]|nr:UDP-3-O-(3-hydroxymyristoyl)glucosamine N-acyltransferase [Flavobacteriales bacterium]
MVTVGSLIQWFTDKGNECLVNKADFSTQIVKPWTIGEATSEHISFIGPKHKGKLLSTLNATNCRIVIIDSQLLTDEIRNDLPNQISFVISDNPKVDLIAVCKAKFPINSEIEGIHPSASVSEQATVGSNVKIGAFAVIEKGAIIGDGCNIGVGTHIKGNVTLKTNVLIGSNTVLGGVGFGYSKDDISGNHHQFPHYGGVIIGNDVSVGANTCIDRGSLSNTIIHDGVKIDNLVHIAHNVIIGKNTLIIALSMIGGSAIIGEDCWVAPSSCIRNGVSVGDNTTVGLATTVTKNVESNKTVVGSPAMDLEDYLILRKRLKELMDS